MQGKCEYEKLHLFDSNDGYGNKIILEESKYGATNSVIQIIDNGGRTARMNAESFVNLIDQMVEIFGFSLLSEEDV